MNKKWLKTKEQIWMNGEFMFMDETFKNSKDINSTQINSQINNTVVVLNMTANSLTLFTSKTGMLFPPPWIGVALITLQLRECSRSEAI